MLSLASAGGIEPLLMNVILKERLKAAANIKS